MDSSHHYEDAIKHFDTHGIEIPGEIKVNFRENDCPQARCGRANHQRNWTFDGENNITVFNGLGSFVDATHIKIEGEEETTIEAKNTIIATGSKPGSLPFISIDKERVITSTEALELKEIPKHMLALVGE